MSRYRCGLICALVGVLALAAAVYAGAPPRYRLTVLGESSGKETFVAEANRFGWATGYRYDPNGSPLVMEGFLSSPDGTTVQIDVPSEHDTFGTAINDMGVVAGVFRLGEEYNSARRAFRRFPDGRVDVFNVIGGHYGQIIDINNAGQIVGDWTEPVTGTSRAVRFSEETGWTTMLPDAEWASWSADINERGDVAGTVWDTYNSRMAWYWHDGVLTELGKLDGDQSHAYYVNNHGMVVGRANTADRSWRSFYWTEEDGLVAIPLSPGASTSEAYWVTDSGLIGGVQLFGANNRPFLYSQETGLVDMGLPDGMSAWDAPKGINDNGEAVFDAMKRDEYQFVPYVYSMDYGLHDLNDLLDGDWPYVLNEVASINECGEITALAFKTTPPGNDVAISVLLTPIRPGDLDADADVDLHDFAVAQRNFGMASGALAADGDLDLDGDVDSDDIAAMVESIRPPCR